MFPFEFHQEFDKNIRQIFYLIATVSRTDKVVNGGIQKQLFARCSNFGDEIFKLRVGFSGCGAEKTAEACQFHMTSFQFMLNKSPVQDAHSMWKTD